MIGVLIVDDEVLCAEGVKCSTDWNALEVDQVYTAYSMKQAMKVLEEHEVDIRCGNAQRNRTGFAGMGS